MPTGVYVRTKPPWNKGGTHTSTSRAKMSVSQRARFAADPTSRAQVTAAAVEANRGKHRAPATIVRMREAWTPEKRAAASARMRGNTNYLYPATVKGECAYCGGRATERDHVIPRGCPGWDDPTNVVLACRPCNNSKGPRTPAQWLAAGLYAS